MNSIFASAKVMQPIAPLSQPETSMVAKLPRHQRLTLTPAQREELQHLSIHMGISLQQAYVRLRSGAITLSTK